MPTAALRSITVLAAAAVTVAVLAPTANAAPAATGSGNAGSAEMIVDGAGVSVAPLAPCTISESGTTHAVGVTAGGVLAYGPSESACAYDSAKRTSSVSVEGNDFDYSGLVEHGGADLFVDRYRASCAGFADHTTGHFELKGYRGFDLPNPLPAGHTITVPGDTPEDPPLATIVFGEVVPSSTTDGSTTLHTMHIKPFPEGGPQAGDVYVGTVHCSLT